MLCHAFSLSCHETVLCFLYEMWVKATLHSATQESVKMIRSISYIALLNCG